MGKDAEKRKPKTDLEIGRSILIQLYWKQDRGINRDDLSRVYEVPGEYIRRLMVAMASLGWCTLEDDEGYYRILLPQGFDAIVQLHFE